MRIDFIIWLSMLFLYGSFHLQAQEISSGAATVQSQPFSELLQLLKEREEALATIQVSVDRTCFEGKDQAAYNTTRKIEANKLLRFFGQQAQQGTPRPAKSTVHPLNGMFHLAMDFGQDKKRYDITPTEGNNFTRYYDGNVWQTDHVQSRGPDYPRLMIDEFIPETEVLQSLGYSGSFLSMNTSGMFPLHASPLPLSEYLDELNTAGLVLNVERDHSDGNDQFVVEFIEPTLTPIPGIRPQPQETSRPLIHAVQQLNNAEVKAHLQQAEEYFCHQVRLRFHLEQGMSPRFAEGKVVVKDKREGRWKEVLPEQHWRIEWLDQHQVAENILLPRMTRVTTGMGLLRSKGEDYVRKNNSTTNNKSDESFDWSQTEFEMFEELWVIEYRFSNVVVNAEIPVPLFPESFPAGTVYQDNRHPRRLYRLREAGSPLFNNVSDVVERERTSAERAVTTGKSSNVLRLQQSDDLSWGVIGVITAGGLILMLVILLGVYYARKRNSLIE
ncbi:MAG: hypothetical protein KDA65_11695 [Planctomycetaceae bacterium]|nr:hypothetical protein [Planctomycetaceae bacterium]